MGVVIGSKNRRFCFRRRRFSCIFSELKPLRWVSLAKFSAVGKECTRLQERKDKAKDPTERIDTFMEKASRIGPATVEHKRIVRGLCQKPKKTSLEKHLSISCVRAVPRTIKVSNSRYTARDFCPRRSRGGGLPHWPRSVIIRVTCCHD
jgi:hypothetical protein